MRFSLSVGVLVLLSVPTVMLAQPAKRTTPHTADGHPDLQGTYDIASMTPLERTPGTPLVMTRDEAAALERHRRDC